VTTPDTPTSWTPRPAALWAWLVFVLCALTIFYPMLSGQFLGGDDQVIAGYGFRQFAADYFKSYGSIPQWNPYLFGGMPFFGVIGHGDIFYPTAWLRWVVPTGFGMTLGFFLHVVLAGGAMYALLRGLRLSWVAAVVGGVAYQMSGIVLSQISPGHDGKLFVSALAPIAFLALLRGIREGKLGWFGGLAVVIGLAILSPQVQMAYYLLVALGLWALWLVFFDPERIRGRSPIAPLGFATLAVILGLGIAAIQLMPIFDYVQWTPRAQGGDSVGWAYATSYSFHIKEFLTVVLPQFNGTLDHYWGENFMKSHTEYLGALVLVLVVAGATVVRQRGLWLGLGVIAGLFLLVSVAADTPFYRLWYNVMPNMKNVRAAGMAFYLVALPVCVWAACGVEALVHGGVSRRRLIWPLATLAVLALLGVAGVLQAVAESIAGGIPFEGVMGKAMANADELRMGSIRLLVVVAVGAGVLLAVQAGRLRAAGAAAALIGVVLADQWSVLRHFAKWLPPTEITYASDPMIQAMNVNALPFRAWDPSGQARGASVYQGSILMGHKVPTVFGYHGMESRFYDDVWGGKNDWSNQLSPTLHRLWAVRFATLNQPVDSIPGFHPVAGPVSFPNTLGRMGLAGFLWESDVAPEWVRVVGGAVLATDSLIPATVADPGYPFDRVALYADTAQVAGASSTPTIPEPSGVRASLTEWRPGAMTIALSGSAPSHNYLLVAENWYPDWRATVDGVAAATHRANGAMLSVVVPPGAREVRLSFEMASYRTGKLVTFASLLGALALLAFGVVKSRRQVANG
jgi:hypothetical protein